MSAASVCSACGLVALGAEPLQLLDLRGANRGVVDAQDLERFLRAGPVAVDADHRLPAGVDPRLGAGGSFLDPQLGHPGLDRLGHAAEPIDLGDVAERARREIVRQPLDIERAAPRIDDPGRARLLLQKQLRIAGDAGGEVGGQGERLVERVGMQRLGLPLRRRHRLDRGPRDVVEDVLRRERPARGLAMRAERQRTLVLRREALLHQLRPQEACRAQLGDLHEEVHADAEEERDARREGVDREAGVDGGADIFEAVGERVGELEIGRRPGFLHVIAGDRDRIELRHVPAV